MLKWVFLMGLFLCTGVSVEAAEVRYKDVVFGEVSEISDVVYKGIDNQKLELDIFEPKDDAVKKRPLVVMIHGGGFLTGSRKAADVRQLAIEFAKRGYVVASIDYRLETRAGKFDVNNIPTTTIENAKKDAIDAYRWMQDRATKYGLAKGKVVIVGLSAGGITALSVAYDGGINPAVVVSSSGAMIRKSDYPKLWGNVPYTILLHGTTDTIVPYQFDVDFDNYLNAIKVDHVFMTAEDVGHQPGMIVEKNMDAVCAIIFQELYETVTDNASDYNKDGKVDLLDFGIWKANYLVGKSTLIEFATWKREYLLH